MAVKTYSLSQNIRLSANFSSNEFKCKCGKCTIVEISDDLVNKLQKFFDYGITKIGINSGYRCEAHNTAVGGAKYSQHRLGQAADIVCYTGKSKNTIVHTKYVCCLAEMIGFNGIARISDNATHVDVRTGSIYRGDEYPATGGPDYNSNIPNNDFYSYFGITKQVVQNRFPYKNTSSSEAPATQTTQTTSAVQNAPVTQPSTSTDNVNVEQNTGVSEQFALTTTSLKIEALTETSVKIKASVTEHYKNYSWSAYLAPISTLNKKSKKISIDAKQVSLTFEDLIPNTVYSLELAAKASSEEHRSSTLIFKTLPGLPTTVSSLNCDIQVKIPLAETICKLSFAQPKSWGAYKGTKYFIISLLLNGNIIDSTTTDNNSKSFKLKDFFKNAEIHYGDTLQIGVQPCVETADNVLVYDKAGMLCTKPIYLKPVLNKLDHIFIKANNSFKTVVMYKQF